jgi:hypothetical protein
MEVTVAFLAPGSSPVLAHQTIALIRPGVIAATVNLWPQRAGVREYPVAGSTNEKLREISC